MPDCDCALTLTKYDPSNACESWYATLMRSLTASSMPRNAATMRGVVPCQEELRNRNVTVQVQTQKVMFLLLHRTQCHIEGFLGNVDARNVLHTTGYVSYQSFFGDVKYCLSARARIDSCWRPSATTFSSSAARSSRRHRSTCIIHGVSA